MKMLKKLGLLLFMLCTFHQVEGVIHEKVLICGVCRNVAPKLSRVIKIVEKVGALFEDYRVIVYENNSTDRTVRLLKQWKKKNKKLLLLSENLTESSLDSTIININKNGSYFRPELIARARNKVYQHIFDEQFNDFSYVIWMDLDFIREPEYEGIVDVFQSTREWDAVFAYGVNRSNSYWDWYAFRDSNYPLGSELLGNHWWYMEKKLKLTPSDDWYPVYSAFGGCGIYKKSSIRGCRYSALVTKELGILVNQIIQKGQENGDKQVAHYLKQLTSLKSTLCLEEPAPKMAMKKNPNLGFVIKELPISPIWRMSSSVYQYPSVCEHVTFHASMILNGHDKLYINPKLIYRY